MKTFIKPTDKTSTIPPLKQNDTTITDETDKANILNTFFTEQTYLNDVNKTLPDINIDQNRPLLTNIIITPDEVKTALQSLKIGKASVPDLINTRILKALSLKLSYPLADLFNQSMSSGFVPLLWKKANVSALYKTNDPSEVSNYRPISLLSCIDKVMEKIIHKHVFNFLQSNNLLTSLQSGFVPKDSTVNQLVDIYNTFCKALDEGKEVRSVFCDISKAFDRVWHKGLLLKLEQIGISGCLLSWFTDYLNNRTQCVVISGQFSETTILRSGVAQGSIVGPLLFLIYINDIVNDINSTIKLFADDTSLYIIVDTPDIAAECLNTDINSIHTWAEKWLVTFNPNKTETLTITRKLHTHYHPPLYMNNTVIQEVNTHKHLGIIFSRNGTWHEHITEIKEKSWRHINIMRKLNLF